MLSTHTVPHTHSHHSFLRSAHMSESGGKRRGGGRGGRGGRGIGNNSTNKKGGSALAGKTPTAPTDYGSVEEYVAATRRLLKQEQEAEMEEVLAVLRDADVDALEAKGVSLASLTVLSVDAGLFGRTVVSLVSARGDKQLLPAHRFSVGDTVCVRVCTRLVVPFCSPLPVAVACNKQVLFRSLTRGFLLWVVGGVFPAALRRRPATLWPRRAAIPCPAL